MRGLHAAACFMASQTGQTSRLHAVHFTKPELILSQQHICVVLRNTGGRIGSPLQWARSSAAPIEEDCRFVPAVLQQRRATQMTTVTEVNRTATPR